jgi:hypothetical protein
MKIETLATKTTWCGDELCPKTGCGCCTTCGAPELEICERCGCDCGDGPSGRKRMEDYCEHGCKTAHGDNAEVWADDERLADEAEAAREQDEDLELAA